MGLDELCGNGITQKILYLLTDRAMMPYNEPLRRVRKTRVLLFVAIQLIVFGATFAITQTIGTSTFFTFLDVMEVLKKRIKSACTRARIFASVAPAAVGFPIIILLLIPLRTLVVPRLPFSAAELDILDRPTASPFVSCLFKKPRGSPKALVVDCD
jgi:hypothetical protein